jgi:hypothetical protein
MSTAAERVAEYLRQRKELGNTRIYIAHPTLYAKRDTQPLTAADLQELVDIALDLQKHERDIRAAAWDEGARWQWQVPTLPAPRDNPYRD